MMDQVDQIMAVMVAAFDPMWGEAWNRRQVSDSLALPNTSAILVDQAGKLLDPVDGMAAGFLMARHAPGESELLLIAVLPEYRGRGLGAQLIHALRLQVQEMGSESIFLEMRQNNPAIHLYNKAGFVQIGERPAYYRMADGSTLDALTFALSI